MNQRFESSGQKVSITSIVVFLLVLSACTRNRVQSAEPNRGATSTSAQSHEDEPHGLDLRYHQDEHGKVRDDLYRGSVAAHRLLKVDRGTATAPLLWQQIGPMPLAVSAQLQGNGQLPGPNAGAAMDLAIDPTGTADSVVYAIFNDGGVWKTTNAGAMWTTTTDSLATLSFGALALDPSNSVIVYAGTGNIYNNGYFQGVGIYQSLDSGNTWTLTSGSGVFNGIGINKIVMPASGVLLVATQHGLFRSSDSGNTYAPIDVAGYAGQYITDLDLQGGGNNPTIWASVNGIGIVSSTDQGRTFPAANNLWGTGHSGAPPAGYGYVSMAASSDGNTLYASAALHSGLSTIGVWASTNAGQSWTDITANIVTPGILPWRQVANCQAGYDQTMAVDPTNPQRVYLGCQDLWQSSDGGSTWKDVTWTYANGLPSKELLHVDHHAFLFSPPSHRVANQPVGLWVGTDGGVWHSVDNAATWVGVNATIATNLFRGIDTGRGSGSNVWTYGGMQDTGIAAMSTALPSTQWTGYGPGDGGPIAVNPINPQIAYGQVYLDNGFGAFPWPYTTSNGGNESYPGSKVSCLGTYAIFLPNVAPAITTTGAAFYAAECNGVPQLLVSTDIGKTFAVAATASFPPMPAMIGDLATGPADPAAIWMGLVNGNVIWGRVTNNRWAGYTVYTIPDAIGSQTANLALHPQSSGVLMAVFAGYSGQITPPSRHVFLSTTGGVTWQDVSGTVQGQLIPDMPIYAAVFDPNSNPAALIVASDLGVLRSLDNGTTWQALGAGFPNVHATSLAIDSTVKPSLLKAGTFGRSAWQLLLSSP
jgi:hypothetical protein